MSTETITLDNGSQNYPLVSEEDITVLRNPENKRFLLTRHMILAVLDQQDGFDVALRILSSRKNTTFNRAKNKLRKRITLLRAGDVKAWSYLRHMAETNLDPAIGAIVLKMSPAEEVVAT